MPNWDKLYSNTSYLDPREDTVTRATKSNEAKIIKIPYKLQLIR